MQYTVVKCTLIGAIRKEAGSEFLQINAKHGSYGDISAGVTGSQAE